MSSIFDDIAKSGSNADSEQGLQSDNNELDETQTQGDPEEAHAVTSRRLKETLQELIKYGLLEAVRKPNLYRQALAHQKELDQLLEPLDLQLTVDEVRGLVFLVVARSVKESVTEDIDEWSHPLVRRQRLNMEQSLLVAILRQRFVAFETEAGLGDEGARVHLDELLPELNSFLGEMGSEEKEYKRLRTMLEKLKQYGIVSEIQADDQIVIRPLIAHLANPENLKQLLAAFRRLAAANNPQTQSGSLERDND